MAERGRHPWRSNKKGGARAPPHNKFIQHRGACGKTLCVMQHRQPVEMAGNRSDAMTDSQTYYHGTKASLKVGDLIEPGYASNYGRRKQATFVYLTATLDAAIWGAELAVGAGHGRIYIVEPTGSIEDDPNLTNKRFAGNPTKSYRSRNPFRIIGEVTDWRGHSPARLKEMHDHLENLKQRGVEAIEE
jgi:hypothetical protein